LLCWKAWQFSFVDRVHARRSIEPLTQIVERSRLANGIHQSIYPRTLNSP